jgi:Dyp-type peroxidase family
MPISLNKPLSWLSASEDFDNILEDLQPNIIKPHTREFMSILFLRFGQPAGARNFLKQLAVPASGSALLKSAKAHLLEVKAFAETGKPGTSYVGVGVTATGYAALGVPPASQPADPSFRKGMKAAALGDPASARWDAHYRGDMHAVVIVADAMKAPRDAALARVRSLLKASAGVTVLGEEIGHGLHNKNGDGIEHFGYVDGRSQPLFLLEDIADERLRADGATNWDPAFGPDRVIVPDTAAPDPARHFGSYFVFRKLEQDVRTFKTQEKKLAKRLGLTGSDEERAGAMLIGRFEDGTPLTAQFADGSHNPVPNNFNYDSDPDGAKCPFFGHIRKVNPRGTGGFEPVAQERLHIMARRGQTYGVRTDDPNDGKLANKPSKDVGLLFMAFNVDIAAQFEFAQATWANNPGFPKVPAGVGAPGLDPVIGQGARPDIRCPLHWGADPADPKAYKTTSAVPQAVTMKGGEYFFMPSLAFFRAL